MTPAAVGNWDTTAAVFNGLGRIYMVTDPPTAAFSMKMATWDLTSPVAAIQLAAGAFFSVKLAARDFTSPVAANQLAAGAFFQ